MEEKLSIIMFEGGGPVSQVEKTMVQVRHATLLDNLEKMRSVPEAGEIFLCTNYPGLAARVAESFPEVRIVETPTKDFHFGKFLRDLINRYDLENVFYMGGASIPLVQPGEISGICQQLGSAPEMLLANNSQSADLVAFRPADRVNKINLPPMDNMLANVLRDDAGLDLKLMPLSLGTVFDLDTPTDILVLAAGSLAGQRTRAEVNRLNLDLSRVEKAKKVMAGYYEDIILMGRVGAPIVAYINTNLKCRLRIYSEERGMKALGRLGQGEVTAMMGYFLEEVGLEKFFSFMERVASCAFIDSRVIFAHFKLDLDERERYCSDLGLYQEMDNPFAREFTRRAVESRIPIVLGGHSLVSGGLWALADDIIKNGIPPGS